MDVQVPLLPGACTWFLMFWLVHCGVIQRSAYDQCSLQMQVRFVSDDVEEEGLDEGGVTKE